MFRVYNNHSKNFTDRIFIGEVFQIEVSDVVDLVHPLEIMKKSPWRQLECLRKNAFSVFHMCLKFQIINPMSQKIAYALVKYFKSKFQMVSPTLWKSPKSQLVSN